MIIIFFNYEDLKNSKLDHLGQLTRDIGGSILLMSSNRLDQAIRHNYYFTRDKIYHFVFYMASEGMVFRKNLQLFSKLFKRFSFSFQ